MQGQQRQRSRAFVNEGHFYRPQNLERLWNYHRDKFPCIGGHPGRDCCIYKNCKNYPLMCSKKDCQCRIVHRKCVGAEEIQAVIMSGRTKFNRIKAKEQSISKIEDIFRSLQEIDKRMKLYTEGLLFLGLSIPEFWLIQKLQNDNREIQRENYQGIQLTGQAVRTYLDNPGKGPFVNMDTKDIALRLIMKAQNLCVQRFQLLKQKRLKYFCFDFDFSKILTNDQKIQLNQMLASHMLPGHDQLIYRATEHGMSIEDFYSKCGSKPNLLYLVENEFGKKYGAFCPCPISIDRLEKWETDELMGSFVFSLDLNKKANVIQKQLAIRNATKGPESETLVSFGSDDHCNLSIGANSFQKKSNNWILFYEPGCNSVYETSKNIHSCFECNGTQDMKLKLKEVEVYQIIQKFDKKSRSLSTGEKLDKRSGSLSTDKNFDKRSRILSSDKNLDKRSRSQKSLMN